VADSIGDELLLVGSSMAMQVTFPDLIFFKLQSTLTKSSAAVLNKVTSFATECAKCRFIRTIARFSSNSINDISSISFVEDALGLLMLRHVAIGAECVCRHGCTQLFPGDSNN